MSTVFALDPATLDVRLETSTLGSWRSLSLIAHSDNVAKGFWPPEGRNFGEIISLMHSEIAEAWEGWDVSPRPMDEKCPTYLNTFVEVADCAIRLLDTLSIYNSTCLDELNVDDYIEPDGKSVSAVDYVSKYRPMAENLRTVDSYLAAALEADRKGHEDNRLAALEDAFMSCLAILKCHGQNARTIIDSKMAYNVSRPYKHGKAFG